MKNATMHGSNQSRGASIALIALALLGGAAARFALSPLQEVIRVDLGFTDNEISLIQGAAIAIPMAALSLPIGRLVDRSNRSRLLVGLTFLAAIGTAWTALSHGFLSIFVARMLVGIAVGGALPTALSLSADLTSRAVRGKIIALLSMGQLLGAAAAFVLVGRLMQVLPSTRVPALGMEPLVAWRLLLLLLSLGLAGAALALVLLREPIRQEDAGAQVASVREMLAELASHRRILLPLVIGSVTVCMADAAASIWAVPVLTRFLHLEPKDFGGWMGLMFIVTGSLGVILGGLLADIGQRLGGSLGLLRAAAAVAGLATPMALFPVMSSVHGFAALLGMLLLLGSSASVISFAAMTLLIPNRLRGVSISVVVGINFVFGLGVAPTLVSVLAQALGSGTDIRVPLMAIGLVAGASSLCAYLVAIRAARMSRAA